MAIETLFPNRDRLSATTLFSSTLYQLRKTISDYLGSDFVYQVNKGLALKYEIESDLATINAITKSETYTEENAKKVMKLYNFELLEFEDYQWAHPYRHIINLRVKNFILKCLEAGTMQGLSEFTIETLLMYVYDLDPLDDNVTIKLINHYKSHSQITKLKNFKSKYFEYLETELSVKPCNRVLESFKL